MCRGPQEHSHLFVQAETYNGEHIAYDELSVIDSESSSWNSLRSGFVRAC